MNTRMPVEICDCIFERKVYLKEKHKTEISYNIRGEIFNLFFDLENH